MFSGLIFSVTRVIPRRRDGILSFFSTIERVMASPCFTTLLFFFRHRQKFDFSVCDVDGARQSLLPQRNLCIRRIERRMSIDWFPSGQRTVAFALFSRRTRCIRSPGRTEGHGAFGGKRIFTERGVRTVAQTHGDDTPELQKVLFHYCSREATDTQAYSRHGMFSDWSGRASASSVRWRGRRSGLDGVCGHCESAEVDSQSRLEKSSA